MAHKLKFLDVSVVQKNGLCCFYSKYDVKPLFPQCNIHSKIVKLDIVPSLLIAAVSKICVHYVASSLPHHCSRLLHIVYDHLIATWALWQLRKKSPNSLNLQSSISNFGCPVATRAIILSLTMYYLLLGILASRLLSPVFAK